MVPRWQSIAGTQRDVIIARAMHHMHRKAHQHGARIAVATAFAVDFSPEKLARALRYGD
jgi:hypothetical protein